MSSNIGKRSVYLFFLIIWALLFQINSIFCSAYCKPNSCTGMASNQCTACDYPFTLQANNTCTVDTTSPYEMFQQQSVISNLGGGSSTCGGYTFKGTYTYFDSVPLRSNAPITIPHYSVRFICWVILYNEWDLALDTITATLNTSGLALTQSVSTYSTAELLCSQSTANEWYMKMDLQFPHTDKLNRIRITLSTTDVQQEPWGIKDYMFLVAKCHVACLKCLDGTAVNCSQCDIGYKLSGTVCNQSCLYKYGQMNSSFCVACDPYCTVCYLSAINCSSCQTNGTYESFLNFTSCLTNCPSTFTKSTSNHTCIPCNSTLCDICVTDVPSICLQCLPGSFWFDFDCLVTCPPGFFPVGSNCSVCDDSCQVCSGVPSPCTVCATNYFLYTAQCLSNCPTGFFGFVPLKQCLDCPTYCVTATVTMALSADNRRMISTITFSRPIDFNTFPYSTFYMITTNDPTLSLSYKFTTMHKIVDANTYQIELIPKPTINMSSIQFTISMNPKTQDFYSTDGYMFNDNIYTQTAQRPWTLIVYPQMSGDEAGFISEFEVFNDGLNTWMGSRFVQEIKKSGIFSLILPGAQLCSTVILHNSVQAQNFYEAARFWASFIYFQVPKWQKGPNIKKYMMSRSVSSMVHDPTLLARHKKRVLQTETVQNWRFLRTGHTQYFVFDTYLLLGLLVVCWMLVAISCVCSHRISSSKRSILYNTLHKLHEISLFYITIGVILEWITISNKMNSPSFTDNSIYVYVSLGLSIAAAVYFLIYEVYIFYRLIPFGHVQAGSSKYANYVEKYSYYLRDIRFQQYKAEMTWSARHLLRPYNYQILSCIRLILLVSALPIFHGYSFAAICCINLIQLVQILRTVLTWPYSSLWRNSLKILLEVLLMGIFVIFLGLYLMVVHIYQNLNIVTNEYIRSYYMMGWIGAGFVFAYNILFILYLIIDIVIGWKYTNQQRVDHSRQQYYYQDITLNKLKSGVGSTNHKQATSLYYDHKGESKFCDTFEDNYGGVVTDHNNRSNKSSNKEDDNSDNYIHKMIMTNRYQNTDNVNTIIKQRLKKQLAIQVDAANDDYEKQLDQLQEQRIGKKNKFINFVTGLHGGEYGLLEPKTNAFHRRKAIQRIIKIGNLNNQNYGGFKKEWVKIQQFEIRPSDNQQMYEVKILKIPGVFMRQKISPQSQSNILVPNRDTKQIKLTQSLNRQYFIIIDTIFKGYGSVLTQYLAIRTFLTIDQNLYEPSQEIPQVQANLSQWIEIKELNGNILREKLQTLLPGFPVPNSFIQKL